MKNHWLRQIKYNGHRIGDRIATNEHPGNPATFAGVHSGDRSPDYNKTHEEFIRFAIEYDKPILRGHDCGVPYVKDGHGEWQDDLNSFHKNGGKE